MLASSNTFQSFKEKTRNALYEASNKGSSPFERWTSDSLKCLLISHNVQIRGSTQASQRTLARICDELFRDDFEGDEKDFVRVYTMESMLEMDKAARLIQWSYIEYRQRRNQPRSLKTLVIDVVAGNDDEFEHEHYLLRDRLEDGKLQIYDGDAEKGQISTEENCGGRMFYEDSGTEQCDHIQEIRTHYNDIVQQEDEAYYSQLGENDARGVYIDDAREGGSLDEFHQTYSEGAANGESYRGRRGRTREENSSSIRSNATIPTPKNSRESQSVQNPPDHIDYVLKKMPHTDSNKHIVGTEKAKGKSLDEELDIVWLKPSFKLAKEFEAKARPHRSGKSMKPYMCRSFSTGRHCMVGGCGEQLDLWNEGQISELAQFGSGITNYFKVCLHWYYIICLFITINQFMTIRLYANHSFKSGVAGQCLFLPLSTSLL